MDIGFVSKPYLTNAVLNSFTTDKLQDTHTRTKESNQSVVFNFCVKVEKEEAAILLANRSQDPRRRPNNLFSETVRLFSYKTLNSSSFFRFLALRKVPSAKTGYCGSFQWRRFAPFFWIKYVAPSYRFSIFGTFIVFFDLSRLGPIMSFNMSVAWDR